MAIEQAIFTSADSCRSSGYHLVATSSGIAAVDARALASWGPSHGSLLDERADASSLNFFALPSGAYCVGKSWAAGPEYSGRGGLRVYTQCLVVPADDLARFANNPFAVLRATSAAGHLKVLETIPDSLDSIRLAGRASPVDRALLASVQVRPGAAAVAAALQIALSERPVLLTGSGRGEAVLAGLLNCLPVATRTTLSFSTGLAVSPQRPVRMAWLGQNAAEAERVLRQGEYIGLNLETASPAGADDLEGWAKFVGTALSGGRTALLAGELAAGNGPMNRQELNAWGERLLDQITSGQRPPAFVHVPSENSTLRPAQVVAAQPAPKQDTRVIASGAQPAPAGAPCRPAATNLTAADLTRRARPSRTIRAPSPEIVDILESIDDRVYDAIAGQHTALEELEVLWPSVVSQVNSDLVLESREQYLRHALSVWSEACEGPLRNPAIATAALDVIAVLFGD